MFWPDGLVESRLNWFDSFFFFFKIQFMVLITTKELFFPYLGNEAQTTILIRLFREFLRFSFILNLKNHR
jgi:cellulose synthase/poly-beta-1,6-N-acetylglucosamine synthase-like glycosyltransferase